MPRSGISLRGATKTSRKLQIFADVLVGDLGRLGEQVLTKMEDSVPDYPPPIVGSSYVRTYNLWDALHSKSHHMSLNQVERAQGGVMAHLAAKGYGSYVVGIGTQAGMHAGRWWTLNRVLMDAAKEVVAIVRGYARSSMIRAGFL